jgi:hypothetical protein
MSVCVVSIVLLGSILLFTPGCALVGILVDVRESDRERANLLYNTDPLSLLEACRAIMTNRHAFAKDPNMPGPDDPQTSCIDPRDPKVPPIIQSLHPSYIVATDNDVELELHGGFDHYGVFVLSATNNTGRPADPFELVPGLFYFDEGLGYDRDRWMRKLRAMKPNSAPEPLWWKTVK